MISENAFSERHTFGTGPGSWSLQKWRAMGQCHIFLSLNGCLYMLLEMGPGWGPSQSSMVGFVSISTLQIKLIAHLIKMASWPSSPFFFVRLPAPVCSRAKMFGIAFAATNHREGERKGTEEGGSSGRGIDVVGNQVAATK